MDFKKLHEMTSQHQKLVELELELSNANNSNLKNEFDGVSLRFNNGKDYIHIPKSIVFATDQNIIEQYRNLVSYYKRILESKIEITLKN